MATFRDFTSFGRDGADKVASDIEANGLRAFRKGVARGDQVLVLATPVDEGRARGGWVPSVGQPNFSPSPNDKSGAGVLARARARLVRLRLGSTALMTNPVEYINELDNGSSAQAPNGMTKRALAVVADTIKRARLL